MKRNRFIILLILLLLLFRAQGCSYAHWEDYSTIWSSETTGIEPTTPTNIIIHTDLYEITETDGRYNYTLFDKTGKIVKAESNLTRQPEITHIENDVIRIIMQAGTGIGTQWGFYYNQKNNSISATYHCIFDEKNGLVAHATADKIVVESIYKSDDAYYKEIDTFQKPLSEVAFPFIDAVFSENGETISVHYHSGYDYEETTEVFTLVN